MSNSRTNTILISKTRTFLHYFYVVTFVFNKVSRDSTLWFLSFLTNFWGFTSNVNIVIFCLPVFDQSVLFIKKLLVNLYKILYIYWNTRILIRKNLIIKKNKIILGLSENFPTTLSKSIFNFKISQIKPLAI